MGAASCGCNGSSPSIIEKDAQVGEQVAGYLSKTIGDAKVRRFVVLRDTVLQYYENEDRDVVKGLVRLTNTRVSKTQNGTGAGRLYELRIEHDVRPSTVLYAPSKIALNLWVHAISANIAQADAKEGYFETVSDTTAWQDHPILWETRYYIYLNGQFSSFSQPSDSGPEYSVDVSEYKVKLMTAHNRFCVELSSNGSDRINTRSVVVAFETEVERTEWVHSLGMHEPNETLDIVENSLTSCAASDSTSERGSPTLENGDSSSPNSANKTLDSSSSNPINEARDRSITDSAVYPPTGPPLMRTDSLVGKQCEVYNGKIGVVLQYFPGHDNSYDVKMVESGEIVTVKAEHLTEKRRQYSPEKSLKLDAPKALTTEMRKKNRMGKWQKRLVTLAAPGVISITHGRRTSRSGSDKHEPQEHALNVLQYKISVGKKNTLKFTAKDGNQDSKEYILRLDSQEDTALWLTTFEQWINFLKTQNNNESQLAWKRANSADL